jgi:hypothetical protein
MLGTVTDIPVKVDVKGKGKAVDNRNAQDEEKKSGKREGESSQSLENGN